MITMRIEAKHLAHYATEASLRMRLRDLSHSLPYQREAWPVCGVLSARD